MKSLIKRFISQGMRTRLKRVLAKLDRVTMTVCGCSSLTVELYYGLLRRSFSAEKRAVLEGKLRYFRSLATADGPHACLRRNTHRIEKGLIMRPRRDVFAEDYILETVKLFARVVDSDNLAEAERRWTADVLGEYFSAVRDTAIIRQARTLYEALDLPVEDARRSKPYRFGELCAEAVAFERLHDLYRLRRSVRWFRPEPVPVALVAKAVDIALLAPSACNRQAFTFRAAFGRERAAEVAAIAGGSAGFNVNIPCLITVVGDLSAYPSERDRHVIYIDASLATMQLMLALCTVGLGSCVINWADDAARDRRLRKTLGLAVHERVVLLLAVGYPDPDGEIPFSQKKTAADVLVEVP